MLNVLPHGGPLPPGYGDYYGAAGGRASAPVAAFSAAPKTGNIRQAQAAQGMITKAWQASGKTSSATAPLAIPDFDTWNVGAGMIEKVPAMKDVSEPWYMNKWLWAAGGLGLLVGGYFLLRNRGGSRWAAAVGGGT